MTSPVDTARATRALGLASVDPDLLERALTHPSHSAEHGGPDYERLEFLGDSVLGLLTSEYLHAAFPDAAEGDLSRMRSALVRTASLAHAARALGVPEFVRMGQGADQAGERERPSVLEAAFEALVAAVYLSGGIESARAFVERALLAGADPGALLADTEDTKSRLQEIAQAKGLETPQYRIVDRSGPDHAPSFTCEVEVGGVVAGTGEGPSKQAAEKAAAADALARL